MVFHSFLINAVNPSYVDNRLKIGLKYFIAGKGRCSAGQCGGETMQFFVQVIIKHYGNSFWHYPIKMKLLYK